MTGSGPCHTNKVNYKLQRVLTPQPGLWDGASSIIHWKLELTLFVLQCRCALESGF